METTRPIPSATEHDESLLDWFLSLTHAERLAELESRVEFLNLARRNGDSELDVLGFIAGGKRYEDVADRAETSVSVDCRFAC